MAEEAANNAQLPQEIVSPIVYHCDLVGRIQRRLVDIIHSLPKRSKWAMPIQVDPENKRPPFSEL